MGRPPAPGQSPPPVRSLHLLWAVFHNTESCQNDSRPIRPCGSFAARMASESATEEPICQLYEHREGNREDVSSMFTPVNLY